MNRRLPNPTLGELNLSLPAVSSIVFGFLVLIIPTSLLPSFVMFHPEDAAANALYWGGVAQVALLFSILLCMFGLLELTRGRQRRKTTATIDLCGAAVQLYLWHGASLLQSIAIAHL